LGDKVEAGASLVASDSASGISTGIGYQFHKKVGDEYSYSDAGESARKLERDTHSQKQVGEFRVSYSSVEAFRRGEISVPFAAGLNYERQLSSINTPVTHRIQFDAKVFF
ncbi:hypothetical protein N9D31_01580, partial [Oligoflexaceae bacterium]|nr:hypothetical protein [Oligoflexaceae bacterium]